MMIYVRNNYFVLAMYCFAIENKEDITIIIIIYRSKILNINNYIRTPTVVKSVRRCPLIG